MNCCTGNSDQDGTEDNQLNNGFLTLNSDNKVVAGDYFSNDAIVAVCEYDESSPALTGA